jgi:hypothetical protein
MRINAEETMKKAILEKRATKSNWLDMARKSREKRANRDTDAESASQVAGA